METLYSTEIETRKLPREWRNTICEYAVVGCNLTRLGYFNFNHFCAQDRGFRCGLKSDRELNEVMDFINQFGL